jgi:hypothetical protein
LPDRDVRVEERFGSNHAQTVLLDAIHGVRETLRRERFARRRVEGVANSRRLY